MKAFFSSKLGIVVSLLGATSIVLLSIALIDKVKAEPGLTLDHAIAQVMEQYEGEIVDASQLGSNYLVKLKNAAGLYDIEVRADGSGIADIYRVEAYEQPSAIVDNNNQADKGTGSAENEHDSQKEVVPSNGDASNEKVSDDGNNNSGKNNQVVPTKTPSADKKPTTNSNNVLIKKDKAISIALNKVGGEVEEAELKESGGVRYYIVEVETANDREAKVQINAASGAIMSIAWDDDDDDQDDDDDDDDTQ